MKHSGVCVLVLIVALGGCQTAPDHRADGAEAVRTADLAWADAFARKDVEGYLSFVESTASIQQPNGPTVTGTAEIRALIEGFLALPNLKGTWHPTNVEASRSGDLAYSTGTFEFTFDDGSGGQAAERGKYLEVWRKQADGSWRMFVESFNSDVPLPGAEAQ